MCLISIYLYNCKMNLIKLKKGFIQYANILCMSDDETWKMDTIT